MGGTESAEELVKAFAAYKRQAGLLQGRIPPASRPHHQAVLSRQVRSDGRPVPPVRRRHRLQDRGRARRHGRLGLQPRPRPSAKAATRSTTGAIPASRKPTTIPCSNVTWNDAVAFCRWLSRKERQDLPAADRGRVGIRRPRGHRPRATPTATTRTPWPKVGNVEDSTGRTTFPHVQELDIPPGSHPRFTVAGRPVSAEPLRAVRHARQRLGVVLRLVRRGLLRPFAGGRSAGAGHGQPAGAAGRRLEQLSALGARRLPQLEHARQPLRQPRLPRRPRHAGRCEPCSRRDEARSRSSLAAT